jgi:N-acetylmuramoyl-L-alanine amidase
MIAVTLYLLKTLLCSAALTAYYYVALRNKAFHQWNRFYLLFAVVLSLAVPLLSFPMPETPADPPVAVRLLQTVYAGGEAVEEMAPRPVSRQAANPYLVLYSVVTIMMLAGFALTLLRLASLIRRHKSMPVEGVRFVAADVKGTPFSFGRYLFWNPAIDVESPDGRRILRHELVHIREWHSLDKVFMQLVLVFAWFNPLFWLIRHELRLIHEFIADRKAVKDGDASALASMILQAAYPGRFNSFTNPFFHQSIKRRIRMLTTFKSTRATYISRLLVLPLAAVLVMAFSLKTAHHRPARVPVSKKLIVVIDAGHGRMPDGSFSGARSGDVYEDELVLGLAYQLMAVNEDPNISFLITRINDKNVGLQERTDAARNWNADLFISLHMNAKPGIGTAKNSGFDIYIPVEGNRFAAESNRFASALAQSLKGLPLGAPAIAMRNKGIRVLDANTCPAVLLECGYITNPQDLQYLRAKENQQAVARRILDGIAAYARQRGTATAALVPGDK